MLAGEKASEAQIGGIDVDDLPGEIGNVDLRQIGRLRRQRAAQGEAGQRAQPPQAARQQRDQRGAAEISAAARLQQVELGDAPRIVEQTVGLAGLLGAEHLVDAVVEQGEVGAHAAFQHLLQADDLLRAVVAELAEIGQCGRVPEFGEAARQDGGDRRHVAHPHPHHCRAAEAQNAQRAVARRLARGRPQAALVDCHVGAAKRPLPPFDIGPPIDMDGAIELVEIAGRPVGAGIGVGGGRAVGQPAPAITQSPAEAAQPVDAEFGEQDDQQQDAGDMPQRDDEPEKPF